MKRPPLMACLPLLLAACYADHHVGDALEIPGLDGGTDGSTANGSSDGMEPDNFVQLELGGMPKSVINGQLGFVMNGGCPGVQETSGGVGPTYNDFPCVAGEPCLSLDVTFRGGFAIYQNVDKTFTFDLSDPTQSRYVAVRAETGTNAQFTEYCSAPQAIPDLGPGASPSGTITVHEFVLTNTPYVSYLDFDNVVVPAQDGSPPMKIVSGRLHF